ncbi:MAG: glycosyltransferase family 9 protein [Candidatus Omnitrophica bacterium]|nr:glycosyltransferase family 9 protein [Candidatus Omnitrophota bacterium]
MIGPSNIGDAILVSGVIAAVRTRYPEGHLTLVVGERAAALFAEDPRIQTLVNADRFRSPLARVTLAFALWRYQPQVLVDLRHTLYPLLLKPLQAWRYLRQPPRDVVHMRERHRWKLHAQVPGIADDGAASCPLWFSERDVAHVEALWRRWQLHRAPRIALIAPGARSHIKRWTAEGFAWVADRLITEADTLVVFSGEPDEEPVVEEIAALMRGRAHSLVGLVTIRQLGVVMQRVQLVITNDSGALHLASAVGAPTVAVFGPTDAGKYGPTAPSSRTIRRRLFCAPCERALCRFNHECMRFITPEDVYDAAKELLQTRDMRHET